MKSHVNLRGFVEHAWATTTHDGIFNSRFRQRIKKLEIARPWHAGCDALLMNGVSRHSSSYELRVAAAMDGVVEYLNKHPKASDTRRGVELWLRDLPEILGSDIVETALERLVEKGDIEKRRVARGVFVFGRSENR